MTTLHEPFVLKIRWAHGKQGREVGARHAQYIATRPGVALEETREAEKGFNPEIHTKYMTERPGSRGLFGPDPEHRPDLEATMAELRSATGPSWRLILSLREDDAQALNYVGLPAWQDLVRRVMPTYARALGVAESDMRWVAAHHPEPGHPHAHVVVWLSPEAPARRGALSREELRDARRGVAREVYGPLRTELAAMKTAERDALIAAGRVNVQIARDGLRLRRLDAHMRGVDPEAAPLAPRFRESQLGALGERLQALADKMPGHGRAALAYLPESAKSQARAIADWALKQPQLAGSLRRYTESIHGLAALYTGQEQGQRQAVDRAISELRDRVAQAVVQQAASIQAEQERMELRAMDPARAVAHVAGVTLDDQEARDLADLLRQVQVQKDEKGRPVAQGLAVQQAVDAIMARAPAGTRRQRVEREVGVQARRLQCDEARDRQWAARGAAQRVLGAAHSTLHREYARSQAKAELAQARETAKIEEQGQEAAAGERPRRQGMER